LIAATLFHRWVFHQQDETRSLSTAFEAKVSNISVLGTTSGEARNCTPCPAGYRSTSGNTDCTICPNGTASSPGSEKCNPCKGETFATKVTLTHKSQCLRRKLFNPLRWLHTVCHQFQQRKYT